MWQCAPASYDDVTTFEVYSDFCWLYKLNTLRGVKVLLLIINTRSYKKNIDQIIIGGRKVLLVVRCIKFSIIFNRYPSENHCMPDVMENCLLSCTTGLRRLGGKAKLLDICVDISKPFYESFELTISWREPKCNQLNMRKC